MKRLLALAAIVFAWATPVGAAPITPAVEYSTAGVLTDSRPFTLGYTFTTSTPFNINALGYFADGLGNKHQVGIWDSVGNLLVSTTVLGTDPLVGHFRYGSIPDFLLAPGTYTIGGEFLGNNDPFPFAATGVTSVPGYTYVTDKQIFGSGLSFPTVSTSGSYGPNGILAADFSVSAAAVPEPATLAVFSALAAGALGLRRRMKPATV